VAACPERWPGTGTAYREEGGCGPVFEHVGVWLFGKRKKPKPQ